MNSGSLAPALPLIQAGTLKALAQTGAKRFVALPNVPTMIEQGYKDFVFDTYCALMAPAKVPHEIVAKLEKVCLDILAKPEHKKKLVTAGFEVTAKDAKGHAARIAKEIPMFKKIIEDAGIKQAVAGEAVPGPRVPGGYISACHGCHATGCGLIVTGTVSCSHRSKLPCVLGIDYGVPCWGREGG